MKLLTIIIFSGDRFVIKKLLDDLVELNNNQMDVTVIEWTEKPDILKKKNFLYKNYKNKIKNFKIIYQFGNWEYKYTKFINKFNSKYVLVMGDDDRLKKKNFSKIFKYLKSDYSGITTLYDNISNTKKNNESEFLTDIIRPFNISNDITDIGFTSCQIIKTDLIRKIFKKIKKKDLLMTGYPQNFIILKIIKYFNNWKILNLICVKKSPADIRLYKKSDLLENRLKDEYLGYLKPIKQNFSNYPIKKLNLIYSKIFFTNIISWLYICIKLYGKKQTFDGIKEIRNIIREPFKIKLTLFIIYYLPLSLLELIKLLRKKF